MSAATPVEPAVAPRPPLTGPIAMGAFGVVALLVFGVFGNGEAKSTFGISTRSDVVQIAPIALPSQLVGTALGMLCLALAAYAFVLAGGRRRVPAWLVVTFAVAFVLGFLTWAVAGEQISFTGLLRGALALSVPLVFGAMSGVLCERAGVINIGIEGQLLAGAFLAAVTASLTGSLVAGLVAAMVAGLLVGAVLAVFAVRYLVNQIIVGVVLNVLVLGLTNFFYGRLLAPQGDVWNSPGKLTQVKVPLLGDIPVLGPVLFDHTPIVYLMFLAVIALHIGLFKTRWGLRVRSVGEHPEAADTLGINVTATRFRNVMLGGAMAGLGGAFFSIANFAGFNKEMSAGQGFIALAAMIFGRWTPFGALGAALLFGLANNLQSNLGIIGTPIPGEFMAMLPYLVTIFAVAGLVGRVRAPAADGQPYVKG